MLDAEPGETVPVLDKNYADPGIRQQPGEFPALSAKAGADFGHHLINLQAGLSGVNGHPGDLPIGVCFLAVRRDAGIDRRCFFRLRIIDLDHIVPTRILTSASDLAFRSAAPRGQLADPVYLRPRGKLDQSFRYESIDNIYLKCCQSLHPPSMALIDSLCQRLVDLA